MTAGELTVVVRDGDAVSGAEEVPAFPLTDSGNAERYVYWDRGDTLYCAPWKKFLVWDGRRFLVDTTGEVGRRALAAVRRIHEHEIKREEDDNRRLALLKHAHVSENDSRLRGMLNRLRDIVPADSGEFDADPWLVNFTNGTLEARTLTFREHRRTDRLTRVAGAPYDPHATCPRWLEFLRVVMDGDEELIAFVQRMAGYCLTGLTVEEVMFFFYGTGRNGKSVYISTLMAALGDYARSTRPETFMVKVGHDGIPNDIAALMGARLVTTVEIEEGSRLAESLIKQLTGSDLVTARFLYGEAFDFRPTFKILMAGNHKPSIRGTDVAVWERILTVPFTVTIPRERRDKHLKARLLEELPGILAWAVEGLREWLRVGLDPPEIVRAATEEYRKEEDVLGQFLEECCDLEYGAIASAGELYERYSEWARAGGIKHPWTQTAFGRRLDERGFEATRYRQTRVWQGLRVK